MDGSLLKDNASFKKLGMFLSSKLDWGSYMISIAKSASKNLDPFYEVFSPEVPLYLHKSTIQSCMKYCCHVWAGAPSCYLLMLDQLQKRICRIVGPAFPESLKALTHRRNIASVSLSTGVILIDVHLNWLNWFHFLVLEVGLLVILIDCMII